MSSQPSTAREGFAPILSFWFETLQPPDWFRKNNRLDKQIRERFGATHGAARRGEFYGWRPDPAGRLAEIIVLDQFSRNIYRDNPLAFAQDNQALVLAQEAVLAGADESLAPQQRAFLYMPFMHSESRLIHAWAMELFSQPGLENQLSYEKNHKAIIERFGRYPHRNAILGRASSEEEKAFLKEPGSSF